MVWMDQNPTAGKEGETVLLSFGKPAWRPGAVKRVCVRVCVCVCVCGRRERRSCSHLEIQPGDLGLSSVCVCVCVCVCVYSDTCFKSPPRLCVCVCVCTVIHVLSLLQGLEYHRGDCSPAP